MTLTLFWLSDIANEISYVQPEKLSKIQEVSFTMSVNEV